MAALEKLFPEHETLIINQFEAREEQGACLSPAKKQQIFPWK